MLAQWGVPFSPNRLFRNGENGVWYDPSDFSTMFQDAAGTTPLTAVGQAVGMLLDKSKGLLHGPEIALPLLAANYTVTGADGTHIITWQAGGGYRYQSDTTTPALSVVQVSGTLTIGRWYEVTVTIANYVGGGIKTDSLGAAPASAPFSGNGTFTWRGLAVSANLNITRAAVNTDLYVVGLSIKAVAGNHAVQATPANQPAFQQDANGLYHLVFNGTSSSLATAASVDFSATAQMTVFAGLYSASLASGVIAMAVDSNGTGFNAMSLQVPDTVSGEINFSAAGNSASAQSPLGGQPSPFLAVLTGQADITGNTLSLRKNGAPGSTASPAFGGGTFANGSFAVGSQSTAATRFLNGRIYALIVRGAASTASEIAATEAWVNGKTRAY